MKLLVITALAEDGPAVRQLLREGKVPVYSMLPATGVRSGEDPDLLQEWFGNRSGELDSLLFFSFTTAERADHVLSSLRDYNEKKGNGFPLRGFVLALEAASHPLS
ncbi:MAG TPA: hypothetical protein VG870_00215 [Chitinophagaceae bacterium]|nr:hypothetical protein [Chitinophagaceae bacterium]